MTNRKPLPCTPFGLSYVVATVLELKASERMDGKRNNTPHKICCALWTAACGKM